MATTADTLAAKQAKQKKILIVLGVVLLALAAFQGPKLWKQLNGDSTAAPAASEQDQAAAASAAAAAAGDPSGATGSPATPKSSALVGVSVTRSARPTAGPGQLRAFTLFRSKDPFVQSLPEETSGATSPTTEPTLSDTQPGKPAAGGGKSGGANGAAADGAGSSSSNEGPSQTAPPESAPTNATISVNGTPQSLEVKDKFPKPEKTFVLVSLKPKVAEIAIAGGKLAGGKTLDLKMGKSVTLVNTATGARYTLKLLYTGAAPEQVAEFSSGAGASK